MNKTRVNLPKGDFTFEEKDKIILKTKQIQSAVADALMQAGYLDSADYVESDWVGNMISRIVGEE